MRVPQLGTLYPEQISLPEDGTSLNASENVVASGEPVMQRALNGKSTVVKSDEPVEDNRREVNIWFFGRVVLTVLMGGFWLYAAGRLRGMPLGVVTASVAMMFLAPTVWAFRFNSSFVISVDLLNPRFSAFYSSCKSM